jgi:Glutathione S-transferase, N-terminal domain
MLAPRPEILLKPIRNVLLELGCEGSSQSKSQFKGLEMVRPLKLYNHPVAPNPRRVRIFAAEKGIQLALEDVDILARQSRTPEFLAKNS